MVLMRPAKVTSACDELGNAINELRLGKSSADAAPKMPTNDEKLAIELLRDYVRDLNRGRGMGFVISNQRISYSLVLNMTLSVASAMPFFFALMVSFGNVEQQDGELLGNCNATGECCACS